MYTRSQIPLRSIRLRSIEDRQPKHTRVLAVAGGVDLSFLDSTTAAKELHFCYPFAAKQRRSYYNRNCISGR